MKTLAFNLIIILSLAPTLAFSSVNGEKENEAANARYTIYHDQSHGSVNMVYKTYSTSPVIVYIYNESHQLVFADKIRESGILFRPYNFKGLKPGKYTFKIVEGQRVISNEIVYAPATTVALPQASIDQCGIAKYKLSVVAEQMRPVKVNIYDRYNSLVFSETIKETGGFSKIYNLEKLGASCHFEVLVDNQKILEKVF